MTATDDTRRAFTAGLRELAAWLDEHPDVPIPYELNLRAYVSSYVRPGEKDARATLAATARAMGSCDKDAVGDYFAVRRDFGLFSYEVFTTRDAACERVVVGVETVTEAVPDPDFPAPMVERTVEREVVEWRCPPLLAEAEPKGAVAARASL